MHAPRPTKLRSQRDINLWRILLQLSLAAVALFAITLIPDILDKYGVIHIPSWLTLASEISSYNRLRGSGEWLLFSTGNLLFLVLH